MGRDQIGHVREGNEVFPFQNEMLHEPSSATHVTDRFVIMTITNRSVTCQAGRRWAAMEKISIGGAEPARKLARDKVFEVAADLFYRKGVRAVGVETIVKQADVAKISLYRSFPSKDDLVVA